MQGCVGVTYSLPVLLQVCWQRGSWKNKYETVIPADINALDLDLYETWVHMLNEGLLQEDWRECPVEMGYTAIVIGFVQSGGGDEVTAKPSLS